MLADGGNLFLQVSRGSAGQIRRSRVFKYELVGQRHEIGLGPLYDVPLARARDVAGKLRQQLREGIDPLAAKRQQRQARFLAVKRIFDIQPIKTMNSRRLIIAPEAQDTRWSQSAPVLWKCCR